MNDTEFKEITRRFHEAYERDRKGNVKREKGQG